MIKVVEYTNSQEPTKSLYPCSEYENICEGLSIVKSDSDMSCLGFECRGQLSYYEGFQNFSERLWVWTFTVDNNVSVIVTGDEGNGYCSIVYKDMYVRELLY